MLSNNKFGCIDKCYKNLENSLISNGCPPEIASLVAGNYKMGFIKSLINDPYQYCLYHFMFDQCCSAEMSPSPE